MTLTQDQEVSLSKIREFLADHAATVCFLEGGAGVGKTFLLGNVVSTVEPHGWSRCACTPTHKATNVLRRKLEAHGVKWCRGYDPGTWNGSDVVTGTTAQLLGIGPIISEDQNADELKFGKVSGRGILAKFTPTLLIIDEVSMLGYFDFMDLVKHAKARGMKILAIGDEAQLPPVKKQQIPFQKFGKKTLYKSQGEEVIFYKTILSEIVRQGKDSAIIKVAWAVRQGEPWRSITGQGVSYTEGLRKAFLYDLLEGEPPAAQPEENRSVFIAYRNKVVDSVQDEACKLMYRHGARAFAPGELVLSDTNYYKGKTLMCANQDELIVGAFHDRERDDTLGVPVTLRHRDEQNVFRAQYLSPEELADPSHPYRVELKARLDRARQLKQEYESLHYQDSRKQRVNTQRVQAWQAFFEWRDATVMSFRHPFAITSHKSQGSTYRRCYVDTKDIAGHSSSALYVAVTRPREELILSA